MKAACLLWLAVTGWICASGKAGAHGDVHERINAITAQIKQSPSNAPLYFERAELYRVDGDFTNALADLNLAARIDPTLRRVDFCRGRVLFEAGKLNEALPPLNKYLATNPEDPEAYTTRARALRKVSQFKPAAEDYTIAFQNGRCGCAKFIVERPHLMMPQLAAHVVVAIQPAGAEHGHAGAAALRRTAGIAAVPATSGTLT